MDTRTSILDASERLFSEGGFDAVSTRGIVAAAGVNLAAINYHFGSREGLVRAVLERRLGPINAERIRLLDACEKRAGRRKGLPVREVIHAMIAPAIRFGRDAAQGGPAFMTLMGRVFMDPRESWQLMVEEICGDVIRRFIGAFARALPGLSPEDRFWRVHFGVGAFVHTLCSSHHIQRISGGMCDPNDVDGMIERLVSFMEAGMLADGGGGRKQGS